MRCTRSGKAGAAVLRLVQHERTRSRRCTATATLDARHEDRYDNPIGRHCQALERGLRMKIDRLWSNGRLAARTHPWGDS